MWGGGGGGGGGHWPEARSEKGAVDMNGFGKGSLVRSKVLSVENDVSCKCGRTYIAYVLINMGNGNTYIYSSERPMLLQPVVALS